MKSPCIMDITFVKMVYFTSYLESLRLAGREKHIVFLDPDLLFTSSIADVFEKDFHVGITAMCGEIGLMNPGILFCHGKHIQECKDVHQATVDVFVDHMFSHTGDQRSFGALFMNEVDNLAGALKPVMGGKWNSVLTRSGWRVLFLPGHVFNATPSKYLSESARVLHYKGPLPRKKLGLDHYMRFWKRGKSHLFMRKFAKMPPKNLSCKWV